MRRDVVDVHQHLWPVEFVDALRRRSRPPRLDGWVLHLATEPPFVVNPLDHDVAARTRIDQDCARVILGLSTPLGIEHLPPDEGEPLLRAWHHGVRQLPPPFGAWASVTSADPDLIGLKELLGDGFVGLQVAATDLASPMDLERLAELLTVCQDADAPVLVHPGPVRPDPVDRAGQDQPPWWPAVVEYPAQLQRAWWAWQCAGRSLLPTLRICFVAGAGLAPVHHERFTARARERFVVDSGVFVDTSSYGRQGLDALVRVLGIDAVVLGSDRPYAGRTDPDLGAAATHAVRVTNPARLLGGHGSPGTPHRPHHPAHRLSKGERP